MVSVLPPEAWLLALVSLVSTDRSPLSLELSAPGFACSELSVTLPSPVPLASEEAFAAPPEVLLEVWDVASADAAPLLSSSPLPEVAPAVAAAPEVVSVVVVVALAPESVTEPMPVALMPALTVVAPTEAPLV